MGSGKFCQTTRLDFFRFGQQCRLNNDLYQTTTCRLDDRHNIVLHKIILAGFQHSDVNHHVKFGGAIFERNLGFLGLSPGQISTERKTDYRCHRNPTFFKLLNTITNMYWIDTYGSKGIFDGFPAELI